MPMNQLKGSSLPLASLWSRSSNSNLRSHLGADYPSVPLKGPQTLKSGRVAGAIADKAGLGVFGDDIVMC